MGSRMVAHLMVANSSQALALGPDPKVAYFVEGAMVQLSAEL